MKILALVTLCSMVGYAVCGSVNNCISRCDFMDGQCTQAIMNPDGSCLTTIPGVWGQWQEWRSCTGECSFQSGVRNRSRFCDDPAPKFGGDYCPGSDHDDEICSNDWGKSPWCSQSACLAKFRVVADKTVDLYSECPSLFNYTDPLAVPSVDRCRELSCEAGANVFNWRQDGQGTECSAGKCEGYDMHYTSREGFIIEATFQGWADWAPWSTCIGDCAFTLGNKNRTRGCEMRHPPFGGEGCPGPPGEEVPCDPTYGSPDCPISACKFKLRDNTGEVKSNCPLKGANNSLPGITDCKMFACSLDANVINWRSSDNLCEARQCADYDIMYIPETTHVIHVYSTFNGWTEWAPWEDCTGECTFVPTTKFRNRTCLLPVSDSKYPNTDTPMSGCPTNSTETRDCHRYWQRGSINCPIEYCENDTDSPWNAADESKSMFSECAYLGDTTDCSGCEDSDDEWDRCRNFTCRLGGNVFNLKVSSDGGFDCNARRCADYELHLSNSGTGYTVWMSMQEGWSQWSPFDPCRGDCTHTPYTRTRYRTCRNNVTSFGADACPPPTSPTETRDCDHRWNATGDCSYGKCESDFKLADDSDLYSNCTEIARSTSCSGSCDVAECAAWTCRLAPNANTFNWKVQKHGYECHAKRCEDYELHRIEFGDPGDKWEIHTSFGNSSVGWGWGWSVWGSWSHCERECGFVMFSTKSRNRTCLDEFTPSGIPACSGELNQTRRCDARWGSKDCTFGDCYDLFRTIDETGKVTSNCTTIATITNITLVTGIEDCRRWTCEQQANTINWFPATGECRAHQCDTYDMHFVPIDKYAPENKGAKTEATFMGWTHWTAWSECVGECGFQMGTKYRNRTCLIPEPEIGVPGCPGDTNQTVNCNATWCSEDCPCDTCVSEFVEIDSTKRVKSGCDVLANNTEPTEVQDVANCTVWACAQGANVINWKSEGLNRECYALRCNDYNIKITDSVRGEGYDIFATFNCWNQWSSWSNCSYGECGFHLGTKTRNRTCLCDEFTPFGAESCPTDSNQTIPCDPSWGSDDCPLDVCHTQWETIDDTKTVVSHCAVLHSVNESTSSVTLPNVEACEDLACEYKANVINWKVTNTTHECQALSCNDYDMQWTALTDAETQACVECETRATFNCWTTWTPWTDCAGECGFRFAPRTRNRTCLTPLTPFGTECCPGDDYQEITCDPQWGSTDCPIATCTSEWDTVDVVAKTTGSGCPSIAVNTNAVEVSNLAECKAWACQQNANVIHWKSTTPECQALNCSDYDIMETSLTGFELHVISTGWTLWSAWTATQCTGECSFSFTQTDRRRTRTCLVSTTPFGTNGCPGNDTEIIPCDPDWGSEACPVATCESEWEAIDTTGKQGSGCSVLGTNTNSGQVPDLAACKSWACVQGANVLHWKSSQCVALKCDDYDISFTDTINGSEVYATFNAWAAWGSWSGCSGVCTFGPSTRQRNRTCVTPTTASGLDGCPNEAVQTETCDRDWGSSLCPLAVCQTNSTWSDVDTSETKRSGCTFIAENNNPNVDEQECKDWVCTQGGNVAEWFNRTAPGSGWSCVAKKCADFDFALFDENDYQVYSTFADVQGWVAWSSWSCVATCGFEHGVTTRTRTCTDSNPVPGSGINGCPGTNEETRTDSCSGSSGLDRTWGTSTCSQATCVSSMTYRTTNRTITGCHYLSHRTSSHDNSVNNCKQRACAEGGNAMAIEIGRGCKVYRCDRPTYGTSDDEDREIYTTFVPIFN